MKVNTHIIKSRKVCNGIDGLSAGIGYGTYILGFRFQKDNIRLMLIWWHICIHIKKYDNE